jgi:hypothetical protein
VSGLGAGREDDGTLVVSRIPSFLAESLVELPSLLGADQPDAVRKRLYPDPSDDEADAAEWRRTQHPELFALLADAKRIVEHDLQTLQPSEAGDSWRLEIPSAHVNAWISALNAARLALGAIHEVTADDMDPDAELTADERGDAIVAIDRYAWLQGTLIDAANPEV